MGIVAKKNCRELWAGIWRDHFLPDPIAKGALAIALLFFSLCVALWRFMDLPYYWDAVGYVFSHSAQIHDTNLFPILTTWDVGHPTLFFFVVAVMMKLVGVGPAAGHLATWMFASLMLVAVYGCARLLKIPRLISAATSLLFFLFPLTFACSLQMTLDLPLTALVVASLWFWARGRWVGYFVVGSLTTLVKLYGVLLVPSLVLGLVMMLLLGIRRKSPRKLLRDIFLTSLPALSFVLFLIVRRIVRGPGLTIAWQSGNKPVPIWHWQEFAEYFPFAFDQIFTSSMLDRFLVFAAILSVMVLIAHATGWIGRVHRDRTTLSDEGKLLIAAAVGVGFVFSFAFFQSLSLCARYNLPTAAGIFLITSYCLWFLLRNTPFILTLYGLTAFVFIIGWHPSNADGLPQPLRAMLKREPQHLGYRFENDLRFLDIIRLTRWGAKTINDDAKSRRKPRAVSTNWPFNIALADEKFGYVEKRLDTYPAALWTEVEGSRHPYVLLIKPVSNFYDARPTERNPYIARKLKSREIGDAIAEVWLVQKNKIAEK